MNPAALFWDIVPYVTIAILVVGTWWRYRYDKFGWTTRSSQLYESRLLRIGSPLFHFGLFWFTGAGRKARSSSPPPATTN